MAKKKTNAVRETDALREEVKNLAQQVDVTVSRIVELEAEKKAMAEIHEVLQVEQSALEEVRALRHEVSELAHALDIGIERICGLLKMG